MSSNGFQTNIWGPPLWLVAHTVSFNYPLHPTITQKKQYLDYFKSLGHVLPCGICRSNYETMIRDGKLKLTIDKFKNRETLSRYVYDLHNCVNTRLGKKCTPSFACVKKRYETMRASHCSGTGNEKGCTKPLNGNKKRTIIRILDTDKCKGKRPLAFS